MKIAPSIHHRLLFRQKQKEYLVSMGTTLTIVAGGFLAVAMTGILVLISDIIFGRVTATVVGVVAAVTLGLLWFALPLRRRGRP